MGAWGYEPFDNDSACDWIMVVEQHVLKALLVALRPRKNQKFLIWPKRAPRAKRRLGHKPPPLRRQNLGSEVRLTGEGQHEGLAAVSLVRRIPEIQWRVDWRSNDERTFLELSEAVILQLQKDEGFRKSWREPEKWDESLAHELRAVRRLLRVQRAEKEKRLASAVRKVRRLSKKSRDARMKEKRGALYSPSFREAFKLVDGRDLPEWKCPVRRVHRRKKKA